MESIVSIRSGHELGDHPLLGLRGRAVLCASSITTIWLVRLISSASRAFFWRSRLYGSVTSYSSVAALILYCQAARRNTWTHLRLLDRSSGSIIRTDTGFLAHGHDIFDIFDGGLPVSLAVTIIIRYCEQSDLPRLNPSLRAYSPHPPSLAEIRTAPCLAISFQLATRTSTWTTYHSFANPNRLRSASHPLHYHSELAP